MEARTGGSSLQDRFERTLLGRTLISIFLLVTMVILVTANLPTSRLQQLLLKADHPYLYGTGFDQSWSVFAPDPRDQTIDFTARVRYADGSRATWKVPTRDPVIGEYTDYRWLKWAEYVVSPIHTDLWKPIAVYVARRLASPMHRPAQVTLTNRWYSLFPPGQIPDHPFVHEQKLGTIQITDAMLKGS